MDSEPLLVKPYIPRSSTKIIIKPTPKQEAAQVFVAMGQKAVMSFCLLIGIFQTAYLTTLMICTSNRFPHVAQWKRICLPMLEMWVRSLGQEDPLEWEMATHSSIPAGRYHR